MHLIKRNSALWKYLPPEIQGLIVDDEVLIDFLTKHKKTSSISDYSFLVFPLAKAYEGFLKKLFLDTGMIQPDEYYSDDIRIGRILNPTYESENGNIFAVMQKHSNERKLLSEELWRIWKKGRNAVFHYFPHNFRRLDYEEAMDLIHDFLNGMAAAVENYELHLKKLKVTSFEASPVSSIV